MPKLNWNGKEQLIKGTKTQKENTTSTPLLNESFNNPIIEYDHDSKDNDDQSSLNEGKIKELKEGWKNILIQGDNRSVMQNLLNKFTGEINLIYIDPPFATGTDFKLKIQIGNNNEYQVSKAYSDKWEGGLDSYLSFLYERLLLMQELLSETGSIYLHLDWHVSHYVKLLMDEIFGRENFRNEIIWAYPAASSQTKRYFMRSFDVILFYSKSNDYVFNDDPNTYMEYSDRVKNSLKRDVSGLYYHRGGSHDGVKLSQKVYIKKPGVFPRDVWNDIPYVRANTREYQGFSTQKPERLINRIILASSNEGDLFADFFCGTGTSLITAEKLKRRWIGCDITVNSINICRRRLLDIYNSNHLPDWKKKYKNHPRAFEIYQEINSDYKNKVFLEFLSNERQNDIQDIKLEGNPEIEIIQEKNLLTVGLIDYKPPNYELINDTVKSKIESFSDWIDYWAIDYRHDGTKFNTSWVSFKTPKKRFIHLKSRPYRYDLPNHYNMSIKIVDIFGIVSIKNYQINIE